MKKYDYLIVGSGLFGATFAHLAHKQGKTCLVIDKRPHLGGNIYCENIEGINVHKYGAHIFHTSNKEVWNFVNSIVEFNRYTNSPVANYIMPTLFGLMNLNYEYEGFGVDLLKQERPMVFYSADNQIVARDHQRCFVYNPSMNRSFCYDVLPNGNLKETKQESKFQDLKNYVFSNIQAAEYIERHQQ